ncbi:MAG: glycosyltransferase family 4 protein [Planctomycetes bacterium]|nr:glycosyltransferase family 4 protein [Planctomycetota bacterium]
MRVIVNQSTALGAKTGIGHYTLDLVEALRAVSPSDSFDVFPPAWWGVVHGWASSWRGAGERISAENPNAGESWTGSLLRRLRAMGESALTGYLRMTTWWNRYELYHEPNYIPMPSALPTVATIHDLSVLLHPEWHPADRVDYYARRFEEGLGRCNHLLAVSEFTRQEAIRVLGIPAERVTCTHNGVRAGMQPLPTEDIAPVVRRLKLPASFLLFVGTLEPRKNPLMLMRAYCDLPSAVREKCPLVLAGTWGWNANEFAAYFESVGRPHNVIHVGYVADDDLPAIYGAARALVFPSFYEGFGLPPLEMMACGGAVLASTAGAVAEVVGSKAHLIDADDLPGWRDAMRRVIVDDDWQDYLRDGVQERARFFSWERCAHETLAVYRSVLGQARSQGDPPQRLAA